MQLLGIKEPSQEGAVDRFAALLVEDGKYVVLFVVFSQLLVGWQGVEFLDDVFEVNLHNVVKDYEMKQIGVAYVRWDCAAIFSLQK